MITAKNDRDEGEEQEVDRVGPEAEQSEGDEGACDQQGDPDVRDDEGHPGGDGGHAEPADLRNRPREVGDRDHPLQPVERVAEGVGDARGERDDRVAVTAGRARCRGSRSGCSAGPCAPGPAAPGCWPLVIDHTAIQSRTNPSTIGQRGMPRVGSSGASAVGSTGASGRRRLGGGGHGAVTFSSATATRRIASSSTMPTSLPSSTTRSGCSRGERCAGGVADDRGRAHRRALGRVVRPRVAHHPLQRQHVRARDVGGEVRDVVVGRCADDLVGRADLDDLAVAHDQDPVAELEGLGQVVGDEHHRLADLVVQPDDLVLHVAPDQRVERRERLVEQQHSGSPASARASPTRCCMPPESWSG